MLRRCIVLLFVLLPAAACHAQRVPKVKAAELAARVAASDSVLIVNFWATWCKPCVEEIPHLVKAVQKYAQHKVKLVLVSLDMASAYPAKLQAFIAARKIRAQHAWLDETDADYFCPLIDARWSGAIPATLIVNKARNHRRFYEEPFTAARAEAVLREALGL